MVFGKRPSKMPSHTPTYRERPHKAGIVEYVLLVAVVVVAIGVVGIIAYLIVWRP